MDVLSPVPRRSNGQWHARGPFRSKGGKVRSRLWLFMLLAACGGQAEDTGDTVHPGEPCDHGGSS